MSKELEALECLKQMKNELLAVYNFELIRRNSDDVYDEYKENVDKIDKAYKTIAQAILQKPKVEVDYYTKVKIDRFFELWYKVDCDGNEILHDMKTPQEVKEMEQIRKDLNERGIEV